MTRGGAIAAVTLAAAAAAVLAAGAPLHAQDGDEPAAAPQPPDDAASTTGDVIVEVAGAALDDLVLVGPSGQTYERAGARGEARWVRRRAGGVAADVSGAAIVDGELVVAGRATPMYRRAGDTWFALRIGETGRTTFGDGPTPAIAIGRQVFVHARGKGWRRVGALPTPATHLWAASPTAVWAATDTALFRLKGGAFAKAGAPPRALVGRGKAPWAIGDDGVRDLATGRLIAARLGGDPSVDVTVVAATSAPGGAELHAVVDTGAGLALATAAGKATELTRVDAVPVTGRVAALRVDAAGDAVVVMADGTIASRRAGTWSQAPVADELPPPRAGAGPSRTR